MIIQFFSHKCGFSRATDRIIVTERKFCSTCGVYIDARAKICPKCGVEQAPTFIEPVSSWWYLVPFFFAFLGGIVAWAVNKDRDPRKARNMLIFGIIWSLIPVLILVIFGAVLLAMIGSGGFYP